MAYATNRETFSPFDRRKHSTVIHWPFQFFPNRNDVYQKMSTSTQKFLSTVKALLDQQFDEENSSKYLRRMDEHLQVFYEDVVKELSDKKEEWIEKIEGE